MRRQRSLLLAAACLVAGLALLLVAGEMWRWQRQLARDDALFEAMPGRASLWRVRGAPAFDPAPALLGIEDDLSYRRALRLFWVGRPIPFTVYRPAHPLEQARAELALASVGDSDRERRRRSSALTLLGVLQLSQAVPEDRTARSAYFAQALGYFENAVQLYPENADAKLNLEIAWRAVRETPELFPGRGGSGGSSKGTGAGAGTPGSGY